LPTINELKELKISTMSHYGQLQKELKEDERYYDLNFTDSLNLPRKFTQEATVLPTAREVVDTAVDHVAPGFRRVTVAKRADTEAATIQAAKIKAFCEALLNYFERLGKTNPYRESNKHLGIYGVSIYKLQYDQRKWTPEPKREQYRSDEAFKEAHEEWKFSRAECMPFSLQVLNPMHVLFDPFNDEPQWVIEYGKKHVCQLREDYPNWPNERNMKDYDQAEYIEWWNNTERAVIIDGQAGMKARDGSGIMKHKWRVHPYIIGSSGWGYIDSENKPEKRYVGMLRFIRSLLEAESRNYSIADIVIKAGAWPVRVAKGDRANEMPAINLEYGQVHSMPPGVELETLTPELPSQTIFDFMSLTNGIISGATAPRVVRGLHQPGLSSGFDRQLALGEARLRYGSLVDAQKKMMTEIVKKALIIGEAMVEGPISLTSSATQSEFMSINLKTDVRKHYAVNVEINTAEPEDEVRKHQDGLNMVTQGVMSPQEFIRKYRPEVDPDSEMGRILAARLIFGAQMMQLLGGGIVQKVASNLALEDFIQQMLNPQEEGGLRNGRDLPAPSGPSNAEPPVNGSRSDQAMQRGVDLRELGV
jgi:hypothetical protein